MLPLLPNIGFLRPVLERTRRHESRVLQVGQRNPFGHAVVGGAPQLVCLFMAFPAAGGTGIPGEDIGLFLEREQARHLRARRGRMKRLPRLPTKHPHAQRGDEQGRRHRQFEREGNLARRRCWRFLFRLHEKRTNNLLKRIATHNARANSQRFIPEQ